MAMMTFTKKYNILKCLYHKNKSIKYYLKSFVIITLYIQRNIQYNTFVCLCVKSTYIYASD